MDDNIFLFLKQIDNYIDGLTGAVFIVCLVITCRLVFFLFLQ